MSLRAANQLGQKLASMEKRIQATEQNLSPEDPSASLPLLFQEATGLRGTITFTQRRMTGVYIVGHPVYGVLGSVGVITMPITMPLSFASTGYPVGPLCILDNAAWALLDDCILGDRDVDEYERTVIKTINL